MARRHLLLGVAGIALVAAAGTANAADANMAVTPTLPAATTVAAATGPAIEFNGWLNYYWEQGDGDDFWVDFDSVIDFQNPGGWGFQFLGWYENDLPGDDWEIGARAYRTFGNLTVAPYVLIDGFTSLADNVEPGVDFEYTAGNLMIYNDTYFHFDSFHIHSDTRVRFAVTDQITVFGDFDLRIFDGPLEVEYLQVGVELDLGNITATLRTHTDFGGNRGIDLGVELEHPIGTGPLTLLGEAELGFHAGDGFDLELSVGIRYARGAANTPWWW